MIPPLNGTERLGFDAGDRHHAVPFSGGTDVFQCKTAMLQ